MLCSLFFDYKNENTKKGALTIELDSYSYLFYALKSHSLDVMLNYVANIIQNIGTSSLPGSLIFNIPQYSSRVRVFASSTLN
jgi:hypothetical protein